jgi:hypothetical protein
VVPVATLAAPDMGACPLTLGRTLDNRPKLGVPDWPWVNATEPALAAYFLTVQLWRGTWQRCPSLRQN